MVPWKDLKLTDDYLFSQIMREEDFCKLFLEMLMGIKIQKVVYMESIFKWPFKLLSFPLY